MMYLLASVQTNQHSMHTNQHKMHTLGQCLAATESLLAETFMANLQGKDFGENFAMEHEGKVILKEK
jgi:hypothetical protein